MRIVRVPPLFPDTYAELYAYSGFAAVADSRLLADHPELQAALFGPLANDSHDEVGTPHTYALLDGAKLFGLNEMLAGSGLPHASLFKGAAADDLADVAPYIVQLTADCALTGAIFAGNTTDDPPWMLWSRQATCLLRSPLGLAELVAHFRKYTRVRDTDKDAWNYFRFYAPETMRTIIAHLKGPEFEAFSRHIAFFAFPEGQDSIMFITRPEGSVLSKMARAA